MKAPSERAADAAVFAAVLLAYLSARSYFFNFDGVACAVAVELDDFKHLVHSNHLLYGLLGWAFTRAWRLLGYQGDALYALQVLNCALGAAGAAAAAALIRRLGGTGRDAALGALGLAASYAWWMWSLEAQVYLLGAVPLTLAFVEAFSDRPRPWLVGLLHAVSMLGHAGHCVAAPALAYLLRGQGRPWLRDYFGTATVVVLASYAACLAAFVRPQTGAELKLYLLGSAAIGQSRSFQWHAGPSLLDGLRGWALTTLRVFADFTRAAGALKALGVALAALPLAVAACAFRRPGREDKALGLWLAGHAVIYSTWEPFTIVYRVADLPALWALVWRGLDTLDVPAKARWAALASWAVMAGAYNWHVAVGPDCDPGRNVEYQEALAVAKGTPPQAWVVANARNQVYYPYFAGRRPLNLRYLSSPGALAAAVAEREAAGEPVFSTGRTLKEFPGLASELVLEPAGGDLLRLRSRASRKAGRGKG